MSSAESSGGELLISAHLLASVSADGLEQDEEDQQMMDQQAAEPAQYGAAELPVSVSGHNDGRVPQSVQPAPASAVYGRSTPERSHHQEDGSHQDSAAVSRSGSAANSPARPATVLSPLSSLRPSGQPVNKKQLKQHEGKKGGSASSRATKAQQQQQPASFVSALSEAEQQPNPATAAVLEQQEQQPFQGSQPQQEQWVACDVCGKWRRVPAHVSLPALTSSSWSCAMNSWDLMLAALGCSAPEDTEEQTATTAAAAASSSSAAAGRLSLGSATGSATGSTGATGRRKAKDRHSSASAGSSASASEALGYEQAGGAGRNTSSTSSSSGAGGGEGRSGGAAGAVGHASTAAVAAPQVQWVQCENPQCNKWRKLPPNLSVSDLPPQWFCDMNHWDTSKADCAAPEEEWQEEGQEQEEQEEEDQQEEEEEAAGVRGGAGGKQLQSVDTVMQTQKATSATNTAAGTPAPELEAGKKRNRSVAFAAAAAAGAGADAMTGASAGERVEQFVLKQFQDSTGTSAMARGTHEAGLSAAAAGAAGSTGLRVSTVTTTGSYIAQQRQAAHAGLSPTSSSSAAEGGGSFASPVAASNSWLFAPTSRYMRGLYHFYKETGGRQQHPALLPGPRPDRKQYLPPGYTLGARDYHHLALFHPPDMWGSASPEIADPMMRLAWAQATATAAGSAIQLPSAAAVGGGAGSMPACPSYREVISCYWGSAPSTRRGAMSAGAGSAAIGAAAGAAGSTGAVIPPSERSLPARESHLRWSRSTLYSATQGALAAAGGGAAATTDAAAAAAGKQQVNSLGEKLQQQSRAAAAAQCLTSTTSSTISHRQQQEEEVQKDNQALLSAWNNTVAVTNSSSSPQQQRLLLTFNSLLEAISSNTCSSLSSGNRELEEQLQQQLLLSRSTTCSCASSLAASVAGRSVSHTRDGRLCKPVAVAQQQQQWATGHHGPLLQAMLVGGSRWHDAGCRWAPAILTSIQGSSTLAQLQVTVLEALLAVRVVLGAQAPALSALTLACYLHTPATVAAAAPGTDSAAVQTAAASLSPAAAGDLRLTVQLLLDWLAQAGLLERSEGASSNSSRYRATGAFASQAEALLASEPEQQWEEEEQQEVEGLGEGETDVQDVQMAGAEAAATSSASGETAAVTTEQPKSQEHPLQHLVAREAATKQSRQQRREEQQRQWRRSQLALLVAQTCHPLAEPHRPLKAAKPWKTVTTATAAT